MEAKADSAWMPMQPEASMDYSEPLMNIRGLTKRYGAFTANDRLDLQIRRGEIHAILGENGAGKSTLMNMLSGLIKPDEGQIWLSGREMAFASPREAMEAGIGMVHQHFMLVPALTVAENVLIGLKQGRSPFYRKKKACEEIRRISSRFGLDIDPEKKAGELSIGQQQRVEIVKTLYRGAEFIIMDEPTAVLTPPEVEELCRVMRSLREQGKTILFISHKLQEVKAVADRMTVLRAGRLIATLDAAAADASTIARLMVGREVATPQRQDSPNRGKLLLSVKSLEAAAPGGQALLGVDLQLREGEILGLAGVDGNGQRELCEALLGLMPSFKGEMWLGGERLEKPHPKMMTELGVGYIPEDRHREGLTLPLSIGENLIAKQYRLPAFSRWGILKSSRIRQAAEQAVREFDIRTPSPEHAAGKLSGGNQQKVVLARELMLKPKLLIAMQPTRGMDVGAAEYVHRRLLEAREEGCGILLVSTELEEVLALSDRIGVMYKGRILETMESGEADAGRLGLLMAGITGSE